MSVSFHQSPQARTLSDNPIIWVFSSNQTAQPNFSYVVEVYVNGVLDSRHEVFPAAGARAHIDIMEIARRSTSVAVTTQTTTVASSGNFTSFHIIVKERYGSPAAYHASATSSTIVAYKGKLPNKLFTDYDYTDYLIQSGISLAKFMTFNTNELTISPDKEYFLTVMNSGQTGLELVVALYNESNALVGSDTISIVDGLTFIQFKISSGFIISDTSITQANYDDSAYMVVFVRQGIVQKTESVKIHFIKDECTQIAHCVWLNRLGAFDCFNFGHNTISTSSIESKSYEKQFGEWVGNTFVLNAQNSGVIDYFKRTKNSIQLVSDYITESIQNHLVISMYNSPLCFLSTDVFERVKIEASGYELQDDNYEEEFTEIVELSFPNFDESVVL